MAPPPPALVRSLYRSLLRNSQPFIDSPSLACLYFHQTNPKPPEDDIFGQHVHHICDGQYFQFPHATTIPSRLSSTIRTSFRDKTMTQDLSVAFRGLRELRSKRHLLEQQQTAQCNDDDDTSHDASRYSTQLPPVHITNELRPGTFLLSHPLSSGWFHRSVILLLDCNTTPQDSTTYGAYGLVINRYCRSSDNKSQPPLTLAECIHNTLPTRLRESTLIQQPVYEGGPVQVAVQLLHAQEATNTTATNPLGGIRLPTHPDERRAVYYRGDIVQAATTAPSWYRVFVGASVWSVGQLEAEMERGFWLACQAPVSLVLEHEEDDGGDALWAALLERALATSSNGSSDFVRHGQQSEWFKECRPCNLAT